MSLNSATLSAESSADHGAHATGDASGHATGGETQVIFFLFGALLLGGLFKEVNKKTGIPYTPMLFILGIVCGFLYSDLGFFGESLHTISNVDPHGLLLIFLPVLIFESGFNADWHIFKKQLIQILTLAIPCVFVSAIFVAFSIKVVLGYSDAYYTWLAAFMFGAILSCTDTVAVLALLKEAGASKKFNSLIEGESLINDGTCMVLLTIAAEIYKGRSMPPQQIVSVFLQLTLGGVVLGVIFGILSVVWIRKIFNDEILVVNITLISCYMVYFVAENVDLGIKISGIIALVSLGLFMAAFGRTRINAESEHAVHTFWRYAVYCAETIIFLVAGIIIGVRMLRGELEAGALPVTTDDLYKLGGLYICMTVSRFLAIAVFMPILKRYGYGLTWREVFVLTYGGLRGAIGISFALIVARDTAYEATLRHFILFDMAGCAFLTLVINGTTTGYFVRKAGLAGASPIKQRVFLGYLSQFLQQIKSYQEELKAQPYLSAVDWAKVGDLVGITKLERLLNSEVNKLAIIDKTYKKPPPVGVQPENQAQRKSSRAGSKARQSDNDLNQELLQKDEGGKFSVSEKWGDSQFGEDDADEKLIIECRNRFLMALKGEYYHLFAMSQCGPDAFIILKESTDWDLDKEAYPMTSWDHLSSHFMNPTYIDFLFYLKGIPIVGKYAKNALFNHLSYVYDASLNYVSAHEAVEGIAESFPFEEDVLRVVLQEASENRAMAESYVYDYLNVTFPEINKSIQMKKAAYNILNREKEYLEETSHQGQLDDKEFKTLKKIVDSLTYSLGETNEPWELAPGNEFLKKSVFFSSFTEDELKEIEASSELTYFKKDAFMTKEGQPADFLYVIHKGVATETNNATHFKEKKTVGSVISYHLIISSANRYHTSVVAESIVHALKINLATVKKLVRRHKDIEEFLWRESFYFMTRLHSSDLVMFEPLDRATIPQILGQFTFRRYKPQETIDFTKGGIFLKGNAYNTPKRTGSSLKPDYEDEEGTQASGIVKYHTMTYFPPSPTKVTLTAEKHCWAFHFNNYEKIVDLVNSGAADREKKRSQSMASFRRGSAKIPIKVHKPDIIHEKDEVPETEHIERSPSKLEKKQLDIIDENENL